MELYACRCFEVGPMKHESKRSAPGSSNEFALTAKMLRARRIFQCLSSMIPDKHLCRVREISAPQDHDKHEPPQESGIATIC